MKTNERFSGTTRFAAVAVAGLALTWWVGGCGSSSSAAGSDGGAGDGPSITDAPADAPTDAPVTDDGGSGFDGPACPPYQAWCSGACIPVSVDPDNCGGCGVVCPDGEACAGGACSSSCLPGATMCGRECVDIKTDNDHCGGCDSPCDAGEGCVEGVCRTSVPLGPPPPCPGGGPPITEENDGGVTTCTGDVAQTTFRWALCSCDDIVLSQSFFTDGYDSTAGPYVPGGLGGGVGLNGAFGSSSAVEVWGALWGSDADGLITSSDATIKQELHLGGPLRTSRPFAVGADAFVDGDVTTSSTIDVAGALHVPATATVSNGVTYGSLVTGPVSVPPPCDCAADQLVPIGALVAAHQSDNDNAAIGLDPAVLVTPGAPVRLDLPCGRYYLDAITGSSPVTVAVHGRAAIYIGGDVQTSGALRFAVDPTAELDVFIAGTFGSSTPFAIGSPNYPALSRFYIGGANGFQISNGSLLGAFFYAAYGPVTASSSLEVFGGIFAGSFHNSGPTSIHYDRAVLSAGDECLPPGGPDGGVVQCDTCLDCGNQACVDGECGACSDSSECCPPLICVDGTCLPMID